MTTLSEPTESQWKSLKFFTPEEFVCSHSGENKMNFEFLQKLDLLRLHCGFPFEITSGFRSKDHPSEVHKTHGGTHTLGIAADIKVGYGINRRTIVEKALELGFGGIGVAHGFVHVDDRKSVPVLWTY